MDEHVGTGVDPSERAQHAGGGGSTPERRRRMSARRKQDAVLRLLGGEDLELLSRHLGVTAADLSDWRVYRSTVLRHRFALTRPWASDRADRLGPGLGFGSRAAR